MFAKTARTPGPKKLTIWLALVVLSACFISSAAPRSTRRSNGRNNECDVKNFQKCKSHIRTRLSLWDSVGYEYGTPRKIVVFADVKTCFDINFWTDDSDKSCFKVREALENVSQQGEEVKRNQDTMHCSLECVRYALRTIAKESKRSNSG